MVKIYSVSFIKQKLRWIILLLLLSISAFGAERIDLLSGSSNDAGGCGGDWYKIGDSNNSICTDAGRLRVNDCGGTGRKEFQLPGGKNWTGANGYQQTYPDWYVVIEARTSVENTKIGFWGGSSETRNYDQYNSGVVPTDDYGYVVLGPLSNIGGKNEAKFQLFSKNVDICIKSVYLTDVPPTMVGKPKNVTANAVAYNQINVTWTASDNAASYDVYRAQSNDCASATYSKVTSVTAASFNDTGRTPNTKYCYYIVAVASDGTESSPSEKVTATTPLKPSTVSLTATPVDHKSINLNWTDTEGTAGTVYEIYRGKSATGPFEKIATQTGNTAYTDEGNLSPETTYYYRIQISDGGQSLPSAVVNATTTELISSVTIKVNPNPTVTISGTLTGCPNSTVSLTAEGLGGTPNYTYTWTGATATTGNGANAVLPSTCTNASVSVTVTDAKKCKGTDTKTITAAITVAPSIIANVSGGDLGCNPASIPTLTASDFTVTDACAADPSATVTTDAVQTNGCQKSQTWRANYTNACDQSAPEVTVTYTWTETTAPSISPNVTGSDLGCNPASIPTLTASDFTVTDACAANPLATVTSDAVQTNGCQKSQTWRANYTNACGQAAVEQTVTYTWTEDTENPVIGGIQTSVELTSANCTFTVPDFESTVMSATTDNCGGLTYEQDFAAGSAATNGQTVTVTVTDGCDNHTSKEITLVVPAPPTIVSSNVACDADLLTYHADVTVTYGTATATVTTTSGTLTQDGANPNLYHITQITKGTDITVKVTDANGCEASTPITAPNCDCPTIPSPVAKNVEYCEGEAIPAFTVTSDLASDEELVWLSSDNIELQRGASKSYTPSSAGTYYIYVENTVTHCVSQKTTVTVTENPNPTVAIGGTLAGCPSAEVSLTASVESGTPEYTYEWTGATATTGNGANAVLPSTCTNASVSVTVTDAKKCKGTDTKTITAAITVAPSIIANVSGDDLGCNPASIPTLTASDFTVTDACAANPSATVTTDGIQANGCQKSQTWRANYTNACDQSAPEVTVTYTWKEDAENPVIGDIQTIVELTSANCTFTVPDFESTVMSATTDNCGGLTYEQDFAAGSAATNGQTVTVTVTDGCDNHTSKEITLTIPAPPTIVSSNVACDADLLTYHADVTVTYGTSTATVTTTSGTLTQDGANPNLYHITQVTKGTDITVTVTDANGCEASVEVTSPNCDCPTIPSPVAENVEYCEGEAIPAFTVTSDLSSDEELVWQSSDNSELHRGTEKSYTPSSAGTYYIYVENTVTHCVSQKTTVTVTENPNPTVTLSDDEICQNEDNNAKITLVPTVSGGVPEYIYKWSDDSTDETLDVVETGIFSVTVTDAKGCKATSNEATVTIKPLPTLLVSNKEQSICVSETAIQPITISATNATVTVENLPDGLVFDNVNLTVTGKPAIGIYDNIIVKAQNECGTKTETISITVNALPVVEITTEEVCEGTNAVLTATAGFASYQWEKVSTTETLTEPSNVLTIPNVFLANNGDEYKVTVTDANTCQGAAIKALQVKSCTDLILTKTATDEVCEGATITYTLKVRNNAVVAATDIRVIDMLPSEVENPSETFTAGVYEWQIASLPAGEETEFTFTAKAKSGETSAENKAFIAYANGGMIENASYDATEQAVHKASAATTILPKATLEVTNATQIICEGDQITEIVITSNAPVTVDDLPDGLTFDETTKTISGVPVNGDHYMTVNAENTCNLKQKLVHILVNEKPAVEIKTTPVCEGGNAELIATSGFASYKWYYEENELSGETSDRLILENITYAQNGDEYKVEVIDGNNCENIAVKSLIVNQVPTVSDKSVTICSGSETGVLDLTANVPSASYVWNVKGSPAETLSDYQLGGSGTTIPSQAVKTSAIDHIDTLTYEVTVDNVGCTATYDYNIFVYPQPTLVATASPSVICQDESFVLEAKASTAAKYIWYEANDATSELSSEIGTTSAVSVLKIDLDDATLERREDGGWYKDYRIVAHLLLHDDEGHVIFEGCPVEEIVSVRRLDKFECNHRPNLGRDTTFCVGETYHLNAGDNIESPETVTWYKDGVLLKDEYGNDLHGTAIDVTEPGTYIVHNVLTDPTNLINNGDFNIVGSGGTYYSDYVQSQIPHQGSRPGQITLWDEGVYAILSNPRTNHEHFSQCVDHTTGTRAGKMMVVNGAPELDSKVWCQTISVLPHTNYEFSAWFTSVHPINTARLVFSIGNNQLLDDPIILKESLSEDDFTYCCMWEQFSTVWNSTTYTTVDVCIENKNIIRNGNDFAMDDIYFARIYDITDTVVINFQDIDVEINNVQPYCKEEGKEVQLTATATTSTTDPISTVRVKGYEWSTGEETQSITVVPSVGENEYIVTVTTDDVYACVAKDTVKIEVYDLPKVSLVGDTLCQTIDNSAEILLSPVVTGGMPEYQYFWNNSATAGGSTLTITGNGEKQTSLKVQDAHGCLATTVADTKINALPEVNISTSQVCIGEEATLTAQVTGVAPFQYLWNDDNASRTSSITIDTDEETLRTREYTVTVTDGNGCENVSNETPQTIVCTNLRLKKTASDPVCEGGNTVFTLELTNNSPSPASNVKVMDVIPAGMTFVSASSNAYNEATGIWEIGAMPSGDVKELQITVQGVGSATAYLNKAFVSSANENTYASYDEAEAKAEAEATVWPLPAVSINREPFCTTDASNTPTVRLSAVTSAQTYEWRNASDAVVSSAVSYDATADGTYRVTVTDGHNCSATAETSAVMPQKPEVSLSDESACQTEPTAISFTLVPTVSAGELSYKWSTDEESPSITVSSSDTYSVTVTDALNCRASASGTVTIWPLPSVTIEGPSSVCPTSTTTYSVASEPGFSYSWSVTGDGTISGASDANTVAVSAAAGCGSFTLTLTVKSDHECEKTFTKTVSVTDTEKPVISGAIAPSILEKCSINDLPAAQTTVAGLESLGVTVSDNCVSNDRLTLTSADEVSGTCPIVIVRTYTVTDLCGKFSTTVHRIEIDDTTKPFVTPIEEQPAVAIGDCKFQVPDLLPLVAATDNCTTTAALNIVQSPEAGADMNGDKDVKITVKDACENDSIIIVKVKVPVSLKVSLNTPDAICDTETGAAITLAATVTDGIAPFKYYWDDSVDEGDASKEFKLADNGLHKVVVKDNNGCTSTATSETTVWPLPAVSINSEPFCTTDASNTPTVRLSAVTSAQTYEWRNASDAVVSSAVSYDATADGTYRVTVTDGHNCSATAETSAVMPQKPEVSLSDESTCQTEPTAISFTLVPTVSAGELSYKWSTDEESPSITVSSSDTYSVTVTDALNCRASASGIVTIWPLPSVTIEGPSSVCPTSTTTYSVASEPGFSYSWSVNGDGTISGASDANTVAVSAAAGCGSFTLTLTVTSDHECEKTFTKTVSVTDTEKPVISGVIAPSILEKCSINDLPAAQTTVAGLESLGVTVSDNCVSNDRLTLTSADEVSGTCPIVIVRTYTVTDLCGNFSTIVHRIEIDDTTKPEIQTLTDRGAVSVGNCRFEIPDLLSEARLKSSDNCTAREDLEITQSPDAGTQILKETEVTITVTDACENKTTTTLKITVPTPIAVRLNSPSPICENINGDATVQLVATAENGTAPYKYYWDDAPTAIDDNKFDATNGTHKVRVEDADGCEATTETLVTIYPLPTLHFTSDSLCTPDEANTPMVVLNAITAATIYEWHDNAGTAVSSGVSYNAVANGRYELTVTDGNGCSTTRDTTVIMPQKPKVEVFDDEICQTNAGDAVITLTANVEGLHPAYEYMWDATPANNESTLKVTAIHTTTHQVVVTDAIGCRATDEAQSTIYPLPELTVTSTDKQEICLKQSIADIHVEWAESAVSVDGLPAGVEFNQSTGIISGTPTESGNWTITVKAENNCGELTETIDIVVFKLPELTVTSTEKQEFCLNESITDILVEWSESTIAVDGLPAGVTFNEITGVISGTPLASGNWEIVVTATNPNGCGVLTKTINIVVNPLPEVIVPEQSICVGETAELAPVTVFNSYKWNTGEESQSITVKPDRTTQYTLTVTNQYGCEQMALTYVNVNPLPEFSLKITDTDCATPTGKIELAYVSVDDYTVTINGQTGQALVNLGEGDYTITVIDNKTGCESKPQNAHIYVQNVPVLTLMTSPSATLTCDYEKIEIIAFPDGGEAPYTYSIDGTNFQTSNLFEVTEKGEKMIHVKDAKGCTSYNTIRIDEDKLPPVIRLTASPEHLDCLTPSSHLTLEIDEPASGIRDIRWSDISSSVRERDVTRGGTYSVSVTANNGCPSSVAEVKITEDRSEPEASIIASAESFSCHVNEITLTAVSSIAGSTYRWSTGATSESITVTEEGDYSVTVTAPSGCTDIAIISLSRVTAPVLSLLTSPSSTLTCEHDEIVITAYADGGVSPYTYSIDGTNFQTSNEFKVTEKGEKMIHVKDAKGCTSYNTIRIDEDKLPPVIRLTASPEHLDCLTPSSHLTLEIDEPASGIRDIRWSDISSSVRERDVTRGGTYMVSVTANNGCPSSVAEVKITEDRSEPEASISASAESFSCHVNEITLTAVSSIAGSTYRWSTGATSESITVTEEGDYSVTVTAPSGCTDVAIISLSRETAPVLSLLTSPSSTLTCEHDEIVITAYADGGVSPYTYSIDGTNFQSSNEFKVTEKGEKMIHVKDAKGCTSYNTIRIDEDKLPPVIRLTASPEHLDCLTPSSHLTLEIDEPASGIRDIRWSDISSSVRERDVTRGGTYSVSVTANNGCPSSVAEVKITEDRSEPEASITASSESFSCHVNEITLTAVSSISGSTYLWNTGATSESITVTEKGDYSVTVTAPSGCTDVAIISLSRETAPVLSLLTSPSSTLTCEHDEIVITAYADGGVSPYTYSIDGTNFQTSNEFNVTEKGEKMLYVKDAKGCTSYNTINIEEDKVTPSLTVKQPEAVCYGLSVDLTQEEVAGYYYNYYNADKQLIASATVAEGGTYYVSKVNSANGCATELKPINVQIIEQPVLAFEVRQPQCSSDNGALIVSAVNSYSYEIDGVADADITSIEPGRHTVRAVSPEGCRSDAKTFTITKSFELPTFSAVITHPVCVGDLGAIRLVKDESYSYTINGELNGQLNNLPSGDYEIVVITPSGCESDGRVITVRESKVPQPTFSMDVTQPACGMLGKITVRKDESYRVLVNGMADAEMSNLVPGNYEVKVVSPEGCESEPQMAEISEGNGKFKSPVVHDYKACAEEGTIDLSTLVDESEGTLNWYAAASGSALTAFTSFNADAVQNKTYWVSQTDANGCESDRVRVRVEVLKNVDFDLPQDTVVCAGETLIVRLENKPVGSTAVWSESPSVIASNSSAIKLVPNVSETITATVSNGYCEKTKSMQITVADSQVSVTADTVLCGPSDLLLSAQGGETYEWTLADGTQLTDASEFEESVSASMRYVVKITNGRCVSHKTVNVEVVTVPEIDRISPAGAGKVSVVVKEGTQPYQFSVDGMEWQESNVLSNLEDGEEYEVQVIDGHHCQTSTTFVYEGDGLDIPMYFTPNGDGLNDLWEIGGIEKYPDIEIYIYDRFSKLLVKYKGNDWRGWDGFYLGKRMPSTDYWYLIIIPGRKDITGHFTLLNK